MPRKTEQMSGTRKAAILLISLEPDTAAEIVAHMSRDDIEGVAQEIARLGEIEPEEREQALKEFWRSLGEAQYQESGGIDGARTLLENALEEPEARAIIDKLLEERARAPFHFLRDADPANLLAFIQDEHPQTISLILAHIPSERAARVLAGLSARKQVEVVRRISKMEQTTPDAIRQVERGLENRLATVSSVETARVGGITKIADIMNMVDRSTERGILETLEEDVPELADDIRQAMFVFADIVLVDDRGVRAVLKEIPKEELALALKMSDDEVREKIFDNMSDRAATMVQEEMEYMPPVRVSDVKAAQQRIVDIIRRLEESGDLIIQGRGGEEQTIA